MTTEGECSSERRSDRSFAGFGGRQAKALVWAGVDGSEASLTASAEVSATNRAQQERLRWKIPKHPFRGALARALLRGHIGFAVSFAVVLATVVALSVQPDAARAASQPLLPFRCFAQGDVDHVVFGPAVYSSPVVSSRGFRGKSRDRPPDRVPPGQYLTDDFPVLSAGPEAAHAAGGVDVHDPGRLRARQLDAGRVPHRTWLDLSGTASLELG
jgi:hypothetical protein